MATPQDHDIHEFVYEFGAFRLDPTERKLLRDGCALPLTEKTFQVLVALVIRSGHLVERSELVRAVWKDAFIEEGNLTVTISMLRKVLGDDRGTNRMIETVAKRGYRFLPEVIRHPIERSEDHDSVTPHDAPPADTSADSQILESSTHWSRSKIFRINALSAGKLAAFCVLCIAISFAVTASPHETAISAPPHVRRFVAVAPFDFSDHGSPDLAGSSFAADLVLRLGEKPGLEAQPVEQASADLPDAAVKPGETEADSLLTGVIDSAADQLRARVMLSDPDGKTIWSSTFRAPAGQIKTLEDEIATAATSQVLLLQPAARTEKNSADLQAQRLYVAGRYFWNERTDTALRRSIEYYQQAIVRDPQFAKAYAGMADSYALLASYSVEAPGEAYPNAKIAAEKALQLDAGLAEAHRALGVVALYYEWNWTDAAREFKKAVELSPSDAGSYSWSSLYFAAVGQTSVALDQAQKAQQIDPQSMVAMMHLGSAYYWDHQLVKSAEVFKSAIAHNATFARAHSRLGIVLTAQKDYDGAIREFQESTRLSGSDPYTEALIGYAEARRGHSVAARRILDDLNSRTRHEYVPAFSFGLLYLGLGDEEKAIESLERARLDHSTYLVFARVDPLLDPLRANPRFDDLLTKMELSGPAYNTRLDLELRSRVPSPNGSENRQTPSITSASGD